jgi:sugar/nucleoside kinase (ribokinase family)
MGAAALKIGQKGARLSLPTKKELMNFIESKK